MKRVLFLISRFLDGGIDSVLVEYLQYMSQDPSIDLTLAIGNYMGELEVFRERIPQNCKVVYLAKEVWLTSIKKDRIKHKLHLGDKVSAPRVVYDEAILSPVRRFLSGVRFKRLVREQDVVIDFDCCFYSYIKMVPCKKIAFFHFSYEKVMCQNPRRMKRIGKRLSCYDYIVNISQAMFDEGVRLFPEIKDKMRMIYNAKDPDRLLMNVREEVEDERIRVPYLVAVERLEESQKDIATLLRAFERLRRVYHREEKLYIIGQGRSEDALKRLSRELQLEDSVEFLGFIKNPYPWIYRSKALLHSAKFEGLPTVLVEALLLRKYIVATDCPTGPSEILDGGNAGLLVPVGDDETMAKAIHALLSDTTLQEKLRKGMETYAPHFTFERTYEALKKLLA
jgi:glycosyltransferase involved in cell wall biosynthesis